MNEFTLFRGAYYTMEVGALSKKVEKVHLLVCILHNPPLFELVRFTYKLGLGVCGFGMLLTTYEDRWNQIIEAS